jgi:hypothetical protein
MEIQPDYRDLLKLFNGNKVEYTGRDQFIKNKRAKGGKIDLADIELLREEA